MAEEKLDPSGWPRKVLVLGAKTPGDDDFDKSLRYFKKYVKVSSGACANSNSSDLKAVYKGCLRVEPTTSLSSKHDKPLAC